MFRKEQMSAVEWEQLEICRKYGVEYQHVDLGLKLGVSDSLFSGILPFNGLRHPQVDDSSGWYLRAGKEIDEAEDFFKPLHLYHLLERCPGLVKYLALPAGWRFLVARDYEDVWFDPKLLDLVSRCN